MRIAEHPLSIREGCALPEPPGRQGPGEPGAPTFLHPTGAG